MSITYRSIKGSKLTSDEVDGNFSYLEGFTNKGFTVIADNVVDSAAVTGTTAITTVETFTIPANTFVVGDRILFRCRIIKTGINDRVSHRHSIGVFGLFSQSTSANHLYHHIERILVIKSATITEEISVTSGAVSSAGGYVENQRKNINWTLPQNLIIALNNNSASDSSIISYWELIRIRK